MQWRNFIITINGIRIKQSTHGRNRLQSTSLPAKRIAAGNECLWQMSDGNADAPGRGRVLIAKPHPCGIDHKDDGGRACQAPAQNQFGDRVHPPIRKRKTSCSWVPGTCRYANTTSLAARHWVGRGEGITGDRNTIGCLRKERAGV